MLGFLKRICYDFHNVRALTSVYNAHVRSHLEYASVLWNPSYDVHSDKIESVQKQYVIYALRRTIRRDSDYKLPPYSDRCSSLDLETLARRRTNSCIFFVFDLLTKYIDSPQLYDILQSIRNVPSHTYNFRVMDIFRNVFHRTNYGSSEPINSATKLFNKVDHLLVDGISRGAFRNVVKALSVIWENPTSSVSNFRALSFHSECSLYVCLCHEFSFTLQCIEIIVTINALSNCDFVS